MKRKKENRLWKEFFHFLKKARLSWWLMLAAIAASVLQTELLVGSSKYMSMLYNGDFSMYVLSRIVLVVLGSFLAGQVVSLLRISANVRSTRNVRNVVWKKMLRIRNSAYGNERPEFLLSAITSDTTTVVGGIISFLISVVSTVYYAVRVLMTMNDYNAKLMLAMLALIPLHILYGVLVGRWNFRTNHRIRKRLGSITAYMAERIRNLELIKIYTNEEKEDVRGAETVNSLFKARLQSAYLSAAGTAYSSASNILSIVVAVLWGSYLLVNGEIKRDAWMAFFIFVPTLGSQMQTLVNSWLEVKGIQGNTARLSHIMAMPEDTETNPDGGNQFCNGDIVFSNIRFGYGDKAVLHDVSFAAPEGKMTAIVGSTGSGKTTLLNLLEKLCVPESGEISVGGVDISALNTAAYRTHLAYIQQDTSIFSGTIRDILTYGVIREVTDEELTKAAADTGILEYIEQQPERFNSRIEMWGSSVSGGQRQKLVIARELLRGSDILLLDEPTSALDAQATKDVWNLLSTVFRGKTMLIVTHDMSIASKADQIIVIDDGAIVAGGTHEDLLRGSPVYRGLVQEQMFQEVYGG